MFFMVFLELFILKYIIKPAINNVNHDLFNEAM